MKQMIIDLLSEHLGPDCSREDVGRLLEEPPSDTLGDFAFPCFSLARKFRKSPAAIALELREKMAGTAFVEKIDAVAGYLNFFIDKKALAARVLDKTGDEKFGTQSVDRRVVVEFASPNTNKPLHLGHLRNISIGESVARLLSFAGNTVVRTSINNDRGVHICKSMLAYMAFGNGVTPEQKGIKSDRFVGDYYVLFAQKAKDDESWNERAQELLRKWEAHDPATLELWQRMNTWAHDGFAATYKLFGIGFDKEYYESAIYKNGKEIILDGVEKGVFKKREDGAICADLESEGLGEKVLLRADGTSVYIVQDLYLAVLKDKEHSYDFSLYVVGNEQEHHFTVLKALLKKLGLAQGEKIVHLSYGMVELPEGKMKSREGTVVDADDLIRETQALAREELSERYALSAGAVEERSLKIALAAIKYQLLKIDFAKNMVFDPKKAISFEGDTGPYLLYSYARASSILRKAATLPEVAIRQLEPGEIRLVKKLNVFPETARYAAEKYSPTVIATYAFDLAQVFNEFYHTCPVIGSDSEGFRLALVTSFRSVLKKCLWLLGIEEIEEM